MFKILFCGASFKMNAIAQCSGGNTVLTGIYGMHGIIENGILDQGSTCELGLSDKAPEIFGNIVLTGIYGMHGIIENGILDQGSTCELGLSDKAPEIFGNIVLTGIYGMHGIIES